MSRYWSAAVLQFKRWRTVARCGTPFERAVGRVESSLGMMVVDWEVLGKDRQSHEDSADPKGTVTAHVAQDRQQAAQGFRTLRPVRSTVNRDSVALNVDSADVRRVLSAA